MAGNCCEMLPPTGSSHVIRDSFLSRLPIIFLEFGDPENAHGIPALMMLFRDRSTSRMGDVWASRECVRHNTSKNPAGYNLVSC